MLSYLNYWKISTSPCYSVLFILELSASHTKYSMLVSLFICIFTVLSYMPAALGVQLVILCLTIHIFSPSLVKDLLDLWLWQHRTNYVSALDFMIILRTIWKLTFLHNSSTLLTAGILVSVLTASVECLTDVYILIVMVCLVPCFVLDRQYSWNFG